MIYVHLVNVKGPGNPDGFFLGMGIGYGFGWSLCDPDQNPDPRGFTRKSQWLKVKFGYQVLLATDGLNWYRFSDLNEFQKFENQLNSFILLDAIDMYSILGNLRYNVYMYNSDIRSSQLEEQKTGQGGRTCQSFVV
jgi:hypothetical protein